MERTQNQLPQKLPILRQSEIGVLSDVIRIPMLPAKYFWFNMAKINAAMSLECLQNATAVQKMSGVDSIATVASLPNHNIQEGLQAPPMMTDM